MKIVSKAQNNSTMDRDYREDRQILLHDLEIKTFWTIYSEIADLAQSFFLTYWLNFYRATLC